MSAWLCTDTHHLFIAKAAVALKVTDRPVIEVATAMKLENLRSLNARYGDEIPDEVTLEINELPADLAGLIEDPIFVNKQAACLDYQSCEHDGWRESDAGRMVVAIYEATGGADAARTQRYQEIKWGIDDRQAVAS